MCRVNWEYLLYILFCALQVKENVEFAYESMGLLRFKKEPQNNHV